MSTRKKHFLRPVLEVLEDRALPTLTPTTFADGIGIGSLRDQIITANSNSENDVITLGAGFYRLNVSGALEDHALTGDLDLTESGKTVIIQGQGVGQTVISGFDAAGNEVLLDRLFHVQSGVTVIFNNLTLEGGLGHDDGSVAGRAMGGAILSSGNVTLHDVVVQHNEAVGTNGASGVSGGPGFEGQDGLGGGDAFGGGVASDGGSLTMMWTTLRNNVARGGDGGWGGAGGDGAIFHALYGSRGGDGGDGGDAWGGGLWTADTAVNITNSLLAFNKAQGGSGGAGGRGGDPVTNQQPGAGGDGGNGGVGEGGGGFLNTGGTLRNVTVSTNDATGGQGGAGGNGGATFTGTQAAGGNGGEGGAALGGGVALNQALFVCYNSTLTLNRAHGGTGGAGGSAGGAAGFPANSIGGGVHGDGQSTVSLFSTIVAGNLAATSPDFAGHLTYQSGYNLIGNGSGTTGIANGTNGNLIGGTVNPIDPLLGPLADNGGPTLTHALSWDSIAYNAGSNPDNLAIDQRGSPRVSGGATDIGAYELFVPAPAPAAPDPAPAVADPLVLSRSGKKGHKRGPRKGHKAIHLSPLRR